MKHTPEQLAGMSDDDLDAVLAHLLCEEWGQYTPRYCTDWAATGSLMVEHTINLNKLKCESNWLADKGDIYTRNENPLRAVVECLILVVQDGE